LFFTGKLVAEVETTEDEDSLPKEAQISIIPDPDELHKYAAYAT
jgi:protein OS-9